MISKKTVSVLVGFIVLTLTIFAPSQLINRVNAKEDVEIVQNQGYYAYTEMQEPEEYVQDLESRVGRSGVILTWESQSEIQLSAFNVYRKRVKPTPTGFVKINSTPIYVINPGGINGNFYNYMDSGLLGGLTSGSTYTYGIQEVLIPSGNWMHAFTTITYP